MTQIAITQEEARQRQAWLDQTAAAGRWLVRAASALLVLDAAAAIGFAAGLSGALVTLSHGPVAFIPWLLLGVAAAVVRGGSTIARARLGAGASARIRAALRHRIVAASLALPAAERRPSGALMAAAVDAVETFDPYVMRFLPARCAAGWALLLVVAAVAVASPVSAAILLATLIPFVAVMILAGGAAAEEARRQFAALSQLSGLFADRVRGLPVILAFQAEDAEANRLADAAESLRQRTMSVLRVAFISTAGLEFFAALSVALVAVYAGFSLLHLLPFAAPERLTLGAAVFALALAPEFYLPLRRLAAAYHDRQAAQAACGELMQLEAIHRNQPPPALPRPVPPRIRFEAVTVRYPGEDQPAVEDLEFDLEAGEIAVLLGPSGSGKTSTLNLLLGLAPLAGGEVWIDNTPLSKLGSIAPSVAWVGQSPLIVVGSIAENIALSRRDAPRWDIERAADHAGLSKLLDGRSGGLDALLDERGGGLSGGERRRVAIARALLKPSPILLLDEPTAHLDAAAEAALIAVIRNAARGCTTIIATHSPAVASLGRTVVRLAARS